MVIKIATYMFLIKKIKLFIIQKERELEKHSNTIPV
jgi:hypothetical protein